MRFFHHIARAERILAALALTIAAFGCDHASDEAKATTPREPSENLRSVRLAVPAGPEVRYAGLRAAAENGVFRAAGLDVEIVAVDPEEDALDRVVSREAEFAVAWLHTALLREARDAPGIVNIAQIFQDSSLALLAWKDRTVRGVSDLDNRRVSVWEGPAGAPFDVLFQIHGVRPHRIPQYYNFVPFHRRAVDACVGTRYGEYFELYETGIEYNEVEVLPLRDCGVNFPEDGIYCLRETYDRDPKLCGALADAVIEGWRWVREHPEEASEFLGRRASGDGLELSPARTRQSLEAVLACVFPENGATLDGRLSPDRYAEVRESLRRSGAADALPEYERFVAGGGT